MNFLTYHGIFWKLRPLKNTKNQNFSGSRSGRRLSENMLFAGLEMNAVKNSHYFPACNVVVMLKIEAMPGYARTRGCSKAREINKKKKTCKLGLHVALNFAVNVDFWVCNNDFNKKTEGKNMIFVVFV